MNNQKRTIEGMEIKKTITLLNNENGIQHFSLSFEDFVGDYLPLELSVGFRKDELLFAVSQTVNDTIYIDNAMCEVLCGVFVDEFDDVRLGIKVTEVLECTTNEYLIMLDQESLSRLVFYFDHILDTLKSSIFTVDPTIEYYYDYELVDTFIPLEAFIF